MQPTHLPWGKFWAQRRRATSSRSLSTSLAERGLASSISFLSGQVPRTEGGAWPRGVAWSLHMQHVLFLAPGLKQLRSKGPVLSSLCPWPAVGPWAGDFASLSLSFSFHCRMGSPRPAPPAQKRQSEDVGEVPSAVPGSRWVAREQWLRAFLFLSQPVWHKVVVSPGGQGSGLQGVVPLGSWKAALC